MFEINQIARISDQPRRRRGQPPRSKEERDKPPIQTEQPAEPSEERPPEPHHNLDLLI